MRIRPEFFGLLFGYRATAFTPTDVEAVLPVSNRNSKGVAILPFGRSATYFFTAGVPQLLSELDRVGFPVDRREQSVRLWGRQQLN